MWEAATAMVYMPDEYYQALSNFPPHIQSLVLASKELDSSNPKAAEKMLYDNPEVVTARQQIAAWIKAGRSV